MAAQTTFSKSTWQICSEKSQLQRERFEGKGLGVLKVGLQILFKEESNQRNTYLTTHFTRFYRHFPKKSCI